MATAAASDFAGGVFPTGLVTFAVGQATKVVTIPIVADNVLEGNEGFKVSLSAPTGAALGATIVATSTIRNDDASLSIVATSASKAERHTGLTPFTFTVTRTGDINATSSATYTVRGATKDGANAADFGGTVPTGTVVFVPTESTKLITINVVGDKIGEVNEGFLVTLSNPINVILGITAATGVITNDDTSFSIVPVSANKAEGSSTSNPLSNTAFTFMVTRIGLLVAGSVQFRVVGSGDNPAQAVDFANATLPGGTLNFTAAQTSQIVTINVRADRLVEASEGFTVTLTNPVGATLVNAAANGTIINDD